MSVLHDYGEPAMVNFQALRILGLADLTTQETLLTALFKLEVQVHLVEKLTDLPRVPASAGVKDILLRSTKCDNAEAWVMSGVLSPFKSRPTFLVYAQEMSSANWSGVLDSGGTEMITALFSLDKVRAALTLAATTDLPNGVEENEN